MKIFAIANTENKNYEYLCDLKGRVKQTLPVGTDARIVLPHAIHSNYYLLQDMKRIHRADKVVILDDGHTDLYTEILIYHYNKLTEMQQMCYEDM